MSLQLKFNTCVINSCSQIRFNETTLSYTTSNTGGYGTPNPLDSTFTSATLEITGPNTVTYTINLFATSLFPTYDSSQVYDIPLSGMGSPTSIVDGQWKFVYTISDGVNIYTKTIYKLFYCNSECCVTKMQPTIETCDCCNDTESYSTYVKAWSFLQSLKNAAKCGDTTLFASIKKIVDKLCLNNGCKTCK